MDFINTVEAPEWFIKVFDEIIKYQNLRLTLLGVDMKEVRKQEKKIIDEKLKQNDWAVMAMELAINTMKKKPLLDDETREKSKILTKLIESLEKYAWAKYRYENLNNGFGLASSLIYSNTQKTITIEDEEREETL